MPVLQDNRCCVALLFLPFMFILPIRNKLQKYCIPSSSYSMVLEVRCQWQEELLIVFGSQKSLSSLGILDVEFDFGAIYWDSPLMLYEVYGVRLKAFARLVRQRFQHYNCLQSIVTRKLLKKTLLKKKDNLQLSYRVWKITRKLSELKESCERSPSRLQQ